MYYLLTTYLELEKMLQLMKITLFGILTFLSTSAIDKKMALIGSLVVSPVLINTACAWASDFNDLRALYASPFTGAVTTRTSTLKGYNERIAGGVCH